MTDSYIETNQINLHFRAGTAADKPALVFLHGLTANCHAFDAILKTGLAEKFRLVIPDLRGRGLSSKPAFHYSMADHAQDILGLLAALDIQQAHFCGHSFGGLLSAYLAADHPEVVTRVVLLDAAAEMNDRTPEMLGNTLSRLDRHFPSFDAYLNEMKAAPQNQPWDPEMVSYFRADAETLPDGSVEPYPNLANIGEAALAVSNENWRLIFARVSQPAILLNARDAYALNQPLLPEFKAKETVNLMPDCRYKAVSGNHQTMLYGSGAVEIATAISEMLT